jgi:pyruvate formate lyase activating enzyme
MKGLLTSIQRFSLHDGPGIRTTLFLKGCPLRCQWCSNPETQDPRPQISLRKDHCENENCERCVSACRNQAVLKTDQGILIDHEKCSLCEECVKACTESNLFVVGQEFTAEEVMAEMTKDEIFYRHSGGGVTLSGGEPLLQPEYCRRILERCKEHEIHTVVDTSAAVDWESITRVVPLTDLFYVDLKLVDSELHKKYVGTCNQQILKNIERMSREWDPGKGALRIPFIPGVNSDAGDISKISSFIKNLGASWPIHLLPYHRLGENKYRLISRECPMTGTLPAHEGQIKKGIEEYRHCGLTVEAMR